MLISTRVTMHLGVCAVFCLWLYVCVTSAYWSWLSYNLNFFCMFTQCVFAWLLSLSQNTTMCVLCTEAKLISQVWRCRINHLQSSRNWESAHIQSCHSEHSSRTLSPDLWPFGSDGLSVRPDECKVRTWPPSGSGPPGGGKWREF